MYNPKRLQISTIVFIIIGFLSDLRAAEQPKQDLNLNGNYSSKIPLLQLKGNFIDGEQDASYEDVSGEEYASFEELLSKDLSEEELTYFGPLNGFRGETKFHEEKRFYYYRRIEPSWTNIPNPEIGQKYSFRYDEETDSYYSCPKIVIQRTSSIYDSTNSRSNDQLSSEYSSFEETSEEELSPRTLVNRWKKSGSKSRLDFADTRYDEKRHQFYLIDPDHYTQSPQLSEAEIIKNIVSNGYTHKQAHAFIAAQAILDNESEKTS